MFYRKGQRVEETYPKYELIGTHAGHRTFICFALSEQLGEAGRSYFHRLSRFYSGYEAKNTDDQYDKCLRAQG